jgi:hypothetical protein
MTVLDTYGGADKSRKHKAPAPNTVRWSQGLLSPNPKGMDQAPAPLYELHLRGNAQSVRIGHYGTLPTSGADDAKP